MRQGRPTKYKQSVTVSISLEKSTLNEIDKIRGNFSRGEYLDILKDSDNMKTRKIIDLKERVSELEVELEEERSKKDSDITNSFRKAIYSNFRVYAEDHINFKMGIPAKKMWIEKLKTKDLKSLLW